MTAMKKTLYAAVTEDMRKGETCTEFPSFDYWETAKAAADMLDHLNEKEQESRVTYLAKWEVNETETDAAATLLHLCENHTKPDELIEFDED